MKDAKLLDFGSIQEVQDEGAYQLIFQNPKLKTFLLAPEATMLFGKDAIQQNLPSETLALAQPFLGHAFHQLLESAINAQKWHYTKIVFKSKQLLEIPYQKLALSPLYNFIWSQIQKMSTLLLSSNAGIHQIDIELFTHNSIVEILRELPNNERIEILQKPENASNGYLFPKTLKELRQSYATALYQLANGLHKSGGEIDAVWKLIQTAKELSENDLAGNDVTDLYLIIKQRIDRGDEVKEGSGSTISWAKIVPILGGILTIALFVINFNEPSKKLNREFERKIKQARRNKEE